MPELTKEGTDEGLGIHVLDSPLLEIDVCIFHEKDVIPPLEIIQKSPQVRFQGIGSVGRSSGRTRGSEAEFRESDSEQRLFAELRDSLPTLDPPLKSPFRFSK